MEIDNYMKHTHTHSMSVYCLRADRWTARSVVYLHGAQRHKGTNELFLLPLFNPVVARVQTEERFNSSLLVFIRVQTFNYDMTEIGHRHHK